MSRPETEFHRHPSRLPAVSNEPAGDPEAEYYLAQIISVKSVDDLLSDERLYSFVITAFGLASMHGMRAFIRRILTDSHDSHTAFAAELSDQRLRDLAAVFDFNRYGALTTQRREAREGVAERYQQVKREAEIGQHDEGARLALSFARRIGGVKSIYGVLGDSELHTVVRVALGLPEVQAGPAMDRQAALISSQISLEDFSDPERLDSFLRRFTAQWRRFHGPGAAVAAGPPNPIATRFGLSGDVLMSVQAMKTGSL